MWGGCKQVTYLPPIPVTRTWTVTISPNPSGIIDDLTYTQSTANDFIFPDISADGYIFYHYETSDGTIYYPGDSLSYSGTKNIEITARFIQSTPIEPADPSSGISIRTIISEKNGEPVALSLPEYEYKETDPIKIADNQIVIIEGNDSAQNNLSQSRAVSNSNKATRIIGTFELGTGSTLILRNIGLSSTTTGDYLISGTAGGVSIEVDDSILTTPSGGRAINVAVESDYDSPVSVIAKDSTIEMVGQNARGINIDGDVSQNMIPGEMLTNASLILDNTELIERTDATTTDGMVYAINLFRIDQADLSIINGSRIQIDSKYYYGFRFYHVGNSETESTITIDNSYIKAWSSFYIQANSKNIRGYVTDSTLEGINQSDGSSDSFATVAIDSSSDCNVTLENSTIIFTQQGLAEQQAAAIYYYDNTGLSGGNSIEFVNCDFEISVPGGELPAVQAYYDNFITCNGTSISPRIPNRISIDNSSLNSLISQGYTFSSETFYYSIDPNFGDDISGEDEDGYTRIPYKESCLYNPAIGSANRERDNKSYQNQQTVMLLDIN